jgi:hypothetical protein
MLRLLLVLAGSFVMSLCFWVEHHMEVVPATGASTRHSRVDDQIRVGYAVDPWFTYRRILDKDPEGKNRDESERTFKALSATSFYFCVGLALVCGAIWLDRRRTRRLKHANRHVEK